MCSLQAVECSRQTANEFLSLIHLASAMKIKYTLARHTAIVPTSTMTKNFGFFSTHTHAFKRTSATTMNYDWCLKTSQTYATELSYISEILVDATNYVHSDTKLLFTPHSRYCKNVRNDTKLWTLRLRTSTIRNDSSQPLQYGICIFAWRRLRRHRS